MKMTIISILLVITASSINCKKQTVNPVPKIDVSVITKTDDFGSPAVPIDVTDWTLDNTWTTEEIALFQTPTATQLAGAEKAVILMKPAFPNPAASLIHTLFDVSKSTLVETVITDNMLSVKDRFFYNASNTSLNINLYNLDAIKYLNNTNYRIYYAFYSAIEGLYYKGHGDIKISR
jgi:hypothetical protein